MIERDNTFQETAHYRLTSECRFATGAKRAAIYELNTGNIYSLNEVAREIISGSPDKSGFWKRVAEMGLVKPLSDISPSDIELKIPMKALKNFRSFTFSSIITFKINWWNKIVIGQITKYLGSILPKGFSYFFCRWN